MGIEPLPFGLSWRLRSWLKPFTAPVRWLLPIVGGRWNLSVDLPDGRTAATGDRLRSDVFRIECVKGRLWITQQGDPQDHIVAEGERFTPRASGKVVVQALGDARFIVAPSERAA